MSEAERQRLLGDVSEVALLKQNLETVIKQNLHLEAKVAEERAAWVETTKDLLKAILARNAAIGALEKYGQHADECRISLVEELLEGNPLCDPPPQQACTCGLSQALANQQ